MAEKKEKKGLLARIFGGGESCCCGNIFIEETPKKESKEKASFTTPVRSSCCGSLPGVRFIEVNGSQVGLLGLDEALEAVKRLGLQDEEQIKGELLARVKQNNYVTPSYEPYYKEALWREYQALVKA